MNVETSQIPRHRTYFCKEKQNSFIVLQPELLIYTHLDFCFTENCFKAKILINSRLYHGKVCIRASGSGRSDRVADDNGSGEKIFFSNIFFFEDSFIIIESL